MLKAILIQGAFWWNQFVCTLKMLLFSPPRCRRSLRQLPGWTLQVLWSALMCTLGPSVGSSLSHVRVGVVIISWRRPFNVDLLVRAFLKCQFVSQVLVSNNNPDVDLARWLSVTGDPRVRLVQQTRPCKQGIRFELAEQLTNCDFYFCPDDDKFLTPQQIERLVQSFHESPNVPLGIEGETEDTPDAHGRYHRLYNLRVGCRETGPVRHITGLYIFSPQHLKRAMALFKRLGWDDLSRCGNGEDIVLSHSCLAHERPRVLCVGDIPDCASAHLPSIGTSVTLSHFFDERNQLLDRIVDQKKGE